VLYVKNEYVYKMKLKFIDAQELERNVKATAHKSGKLGFTKEAEARLGLDSKKSMAIAVNEEDVNDKNLYVVIKSVIHPNTFKINKAGEYFYVNTKALFDRLKIDYVKENVVYDITQDIVDGVECFIFKRRETKAVKKASEVGMNTT
jgi:hypothetical protein